MSLSKNTSAKTKIDWARRHMPLMQWIVNEYSGKLPFAGLTVAICSHMEAKTAIFSETVQALGANVLACGSSTGTTQDDVADYLDMMGIRVFAKHGISNKQFEQMKLSVLSENPDVIIDDGAELLTTKYNSEFAELNTIKGACEQTTTGIVRLQKLSDRITFPVICVNDSPLKKLFDNVHGTGESCVVNLAHLTNLQLSGRRCVIVGFGNCGRGVANRLRDWGAKVTVTEINPCKALEAHFLGFDVSPIGDAVRSAEILISATGTTSAVKYNHILSLPDGAIVANVGHAVGEIDLTASCIERTTQSVEIRPGIEQYFLENGRSIYVLARQYPINLAAPSAMGHGIDIIDQTLALQCLAALYIVTNGTDLHKGLQDVPSVIDNTLARAKLSVIGVNWDG